jgi:hypothetical protein
VHLSIADINHAPFGKLAIHMRMLYAIANATFDEMVKELACHFVVRYIHTGVLGEFPIQ